MTIPALPAAPTPADTPSEFNTKAFAFLAALDPWGDAADAVAVAVDADAATATTQAGIATTQAGIATTQASNAAAQVGLAAAQVSLATTQANNAATQASNASASATSAAASFDAFDDRYLGSKTANPTLDNDGNALITGALYFNSVSSEMLVWNGSIWVTTYLPAAGYATLNGVETLTNKTLTDPKISLGGSNGLSNQVLLSQGTGLAPIWGDSSNKPAVAILVTANTNLSEGQAYRITAGAAVTLTLPATPVTGNAIRIIDGESISTTVTHTVLRNGNTIMQSASDLTLDVSGVDFTIWFNGSDWRLF